MHAKNRYPRPQPFWIIKLSFLVPDVAGEPASGHSPVLDHERVTPLEVLI